MSPRKKASVEEAAGRIRQLRAKKATAAEIAADLTASRPDLGVVQAGVPAAPPPPVTTQELREGLAGMEEKLMATEDTLRGVVNDAARSMHVQTGALREEIERLRSGVDGLANQVTLFAQILQQLDVGRLDRAVQSLDEARSRTANPPVQESIRQAAAAIRAGERLPREKIGVTVDGRLYAAMKTVQSATGWNMSRCLDEALECWIESRAASDASDSVMP